MAAVQELSLHVFVVRCVRGTRRETLRVCSACVLRVAILLARTCNAGRGLARRWRSPTPSVSRSC